MEIVIDFDGTVVLHDYPDVGSDIGAVPVLKKLVENKHKLILFTMRDKETLEDAVKWFEKNKIPLYGIQTNPTQHQWTESPKAYGQLIIDDAALGCPLKTDPKIHPRPFVDWLKVDEMLKKMNFY
ncbi:MAG: hypothetical protein WC466_02915 [Candidatus Izemoplasmatales bacterium]